jgi:hypothetical protein
MQLFADILNQDITVMLDGGNAGARGAALLAGMCVCGGGGLGGVAYILCRLQKHICVTHAHTYTDTHTHKHTQELIGLSLSRDHTLARSLVRARARSLSRSLPGRGLGWYKDLTPPNFYPTGQCLVCLSVLYLPLS